MQVLSDLEQGRTQRFQLLGQSGQRPSCPAVVDDHVFLGLPWTPRLQDQAEDRAYRNGQRRLVVVKIPLVENSIDLQLWPILLDKRWKSQDLIEDEEIHPNQSVVATALG